jgi:SOS-response transcriptional repressor LexA
MLKGECDVSAAELVAIERITGFSVPSDMRPDILRVPLLSWVGAAALLGPGGHTAADETLHLSFANLGSGDFFALRVEDDSMDRASPAGSVIIVNRAERTLAPNRYYVATARGKTVYRRWHADPPYLAPFSTNPTYEPILFNRRRDIEVIGRVRRTVMDL